MRIGIDGRWFFSGNPSGRVVVRQMLQRLIRLHPEHEYFVFLPRRERRRAFPLAAPHVRLFYVTAGNGLVANCFSLPWRARKLALDACLFFYFCSWFGKYKKVVFINDVTFLAYPEFFTWKERLYFKPIRFLNRRADLDCTLSQSEKRRMVRCGFAAADKISVVPLGVDESFMPLSGHDPARVREVRARYGLPERFLLYVGRMNQRKNIQNLLRAVTLLEDRKIGLILAGSVDWKMFDLPAKIAEMGLQGRVIPVGHVPDLDLQVLYALATVFCYVSFAEGFGLPPLEAMASGVPVVVSERDSLPETCSEAGTYVDPENAAVIAAAIGGLLGNDDLRSRKSAAGLLQAKKFTWEASADRLLQALREAGG